MNLVLKNIINLLDKHNFKPSRLQNDLKLSDNSFANWKSRDSKPKDDTLNKIAEYFNVPISYFYEEHDKPAKPFIEPESEEVIFMPIIARITAGFGKMPEEEYTGDKLPIPKYMIKGNPDNYFILQVSGDSMYPQFLENDNVLMERSDFADSGEIVAVTIDGEEATLKKLEYTSEKSYLKLIPLNTNYAPRSFAGEEMNEVRIIGIARKLIRNI